MRTSLCLVFLVGCASQAVVPLREEAPLQPVPTVSTPGALVEPPVKRERKLLFDVREPRQEQAPPSTEEQTKLFDMLFPQRIKTEPCAESQSKTTIEEDLAAGRISPRLLTSIQGSFTAVGKKQTAYLIDLRECNAPHGRVDRFSTVVWALVEGETVLSQTKAKYRADDVSLLDINEDGTDEIIASLSRPGRDGRYTRVSILMAQEQKISLVEAFDSKEAMHNRCSFKENPSLKVVVHYFIPTSPGKLPEFVQEEVPTECPPNTTKKGP
jgi:hypothetical protein